MGSETVQISMALHARTTKVSPVTTAADIVKHLTKVKKTGEGEYIACCPAHDDKNPSLSVKDGDKHVIWKCHTGCSQEDVQIALIRIGALQPREEHEEFTRSLAFSSTYANPRTYAYRDKDGTLIYIVRRQPNPDGSKTFRQYHLEGDQMVPKMDGVTRVPYALHLWHNLDTVFIVEGEQAAEALIAQGYPATCNPGGAKSWQPELNPHFKGKTVYILPDNDDPGHEHAIQVAEQLHGTASTIIIADLCAGMSKKADIVDWMAQNPSKIKTIYDQVATWKPYREGDNAPKLTTSGRQWLTGGQIQYVMDANWTVRDIIPASGMGAAYGKPGSGKTFWALDLAMHIASGTGYLNKTTKHGPVVYIPLESGTRFQNRVKKWADHNDINIDDIPIHISSTPLNLLSSPEDVKELIEDIRDIEENEGQPVKIIIIDTLSRSMPGGNENSPEDMTALVGHCDEIWKALDTFLLLVHHTGKDEAKGLRGHSALIGAVDTEIEIKAEDDTFKNATISKQRDGEDGMAFGFKLNTCEIGNDSDGQMLTTCVVKHIPPDDMPAPAARRKGPTGKHQKVVLTAIQTALLDIGNDASPGGGRPVVRCITAGQLKQFAYPAMTSDTDHRAGDLKRAVAALVDQGHCNHYNGFYWI